jgi:cytochrome oxidase Cu insertion factor (SCO1/SenC/PrrC family)
MDKARLLIVLGAALLVTGGFVFQGDGFRRERSEATGALKDALEGKAPPALQVTEWLNLEGKPPTWKDLEGKVVVLDFWAHW